MAKRALLGYKLKTSDLVVTSKSDVKNAKDDEFEPVYMLIPVETIKRMAQEIKEFEEYERKNQIS